MPAPRPVVSSLPPVTILDSKQGIRHVSNDVSDFATAVDRPVSAAGADDEILHTSRDPPRAVILHERPMNTRLLVDAIVRQTMVLIAQLSTAAGIRAPLVNVANQVFLDLVAELERQGVGQKVIADMFGLALRSYQQKVQRLSESATDGGTTLWEAVFRFLNDHEITTRREVQKRFARDDAASVASILNDLVESGLVYKSGRGEETLYRITHPKDFERASSKEPRDREATLVWVIIYRQGPISRVNLGEHVALTPSALDAALAALERDGRIGSEPRDGDIVYRAETCVVPLGTPAGWEAAVLDHYGAVVGTVCAKLAALSEPAQSGDTVGGSTFSFDVWPGHPHETRARSLLQKTRAEIVELWDEVRAFNARADRPETFDRVTFYFGQNVKSEGPSK